MQAVSGVVLVKDDLAFLEITAPQLICQPYSTYWNPEALPTSFLNRSDTSICSPSAWAITLAASTTAVPKKSSSSLMVSPTFNPILTLIPS